jgi:hypothetical protein
MDYIFSRLALGNVRDAQADPPVDAILNISEFHYPTTRIYRYLYFPDGVYIQPVGLIGECTQFIHEQLRFGAAYLYECGMSLDEAIELIRSKRPIVDPAPLLLRALRDYYHIPE